MASTDSVSGKFARAYQACEPCRLKKVRCNLGTVDSPHDPPCARCRRESKDCYFTATRKRKVTEKEADAYVQRNKRRRSLPAPAKHPKTPYDANPAEPNRDDKRGSLNEDSAPTGQQEVISDDVLENAAYTPNDALDILYQAVSVDTNGDVQGTSLPVDAQAQGRFPPTDVNSSDQDKLGRQEALESWSEVRFVRDGLFSAEEAIFYIEYFNTYLRPFTPVLSEDFRNLVSHRQLTEDNPVLAVAILMLASRYADLPAAGSVSRRYIIHERLWHFFQDMIMRIFWAQDPYPKFFAGGAPKQVLRNLGACEALLLVTEWHPRSVHFPTSFDDINITNAKSENKNCFSQRDPSIWMEWSWRSDRLRWSLLGCAISLAFELGVFRDQDFGMSDKNDAMDGEWKDIASRDRAHRIGQYLCVYATQISGRLGSNHCRPYRLPEDQGIGSDITTRLWMGIASLTKQGNELLFRSPEHTKSIIHSGRYLGNLYILQSSLEELVKELEQADCEKTTYIMIAMELAYLRVYFNSVAAQAIIENKRRRQQPHRSNEDFVRQVIDGSNCILQCVVDDLLPDGRLKYIPIRSYSRILTASLFLLKTSRLYVTSQAETAASLTLLRQVGEAFQTCSVDDAHLSFRWGSLLLYLSSKHAEALNQGTDGSSQEDQPGDVENSIIYQEPVHVCTSGEQIAAITQLNYDYGGANAPTCQPLCLDFIDESLVDLGFGYSQVGWGWNLGQDF